MFHKIKEAYPLPDKRVSILFADGTTKTYDANPLIDRLDAFMPLKNDSFFEMMEVDTGGYGLIWDDDIDLSCDELWEHGVTQAAMEREYGQPLAK